MKPIVNIEDLQRFNAKFIIDEKTKCWNWIAFINDGYGMFSHRGNKFAHRYSYEINIGDIPDGLCVLHKCDNRKCVNPDHLFIGTIKDNNKDRENKGRGRGSKTHCKRGHERTEENLYIRTQRDGYIFRQCKICMKERYYNSYYGDLS